MLITIGTTHFQAEHICWAAKDQVAKLAQLDQVLVLNQKIQQQLQAEVQKVMQAKKPCKPKRYRSPRFHRRMAVFLCRIK